MPRAPLLTRQSIQERKLEPLSTAKVKAIAEQWKVPQEKRSEFERTLRSSVESFHLVALADKQEHPANMAASFKMFSEQARRFLSEVKSLPDGLRIEADPGNLELNVHLALKNLEASLEAAIEKAQLARSRWQSRNRSAKQAFRRDRLKQLARELFQLFRQYSPAPPTKKSQKAHILNARRGVSDALRTLEIRHANVKKDPKNIGLDDGWIADFVLRSSEFSVRRKTPKNRKR